MTLRVLMRSAGKSAIRGTAVLLVLALALTGCDRDTPSLLVRAVAVGVPSLAPFFDESQGLGRDTQVRTQTAHGGLQQGDTPGLYGGSKQPTICDVGKLEEFLTDPAHERKAQAWASVHSLTTAEIPDYLDRLTPVLLRHDTLVKNHDYKKEKAVSFDSLLQAGIAILVDEQGLPAVKCSCGNPLRPFEGDTTRIKVDFHGGNVKWKGYDKSSVVAVRPAPRKLERLALVDVEDPDRGIERPTGTTGEDDTAFDARERRTVPPLTGATFGQASRRLADKGLAVAYDSAGLPPDDARVTASDPPAGTGLRFGEYVTLSVAGESPGASEEATTPPASGSASGSGAGSGAPQPSHGSSTSSPSTSSPAASTAPTASSPSAPSDSGPPSTPPSSAPPSSGTPPGAGPPTPSTKEPADSTPPPANSSAPQTTGATPPSTPAGSGAPPPGAGSPASTAPVTSAPASSAPSTTTEPPGSAPSTGASTTRPPSTGPPESDGPAAGAAVQRPRSAPAPTRE